MAAKIRRHTSDEALAEPTFKLGVFFLEQGNEELARTYWERAQQLYPDNWSFHRQDWSFTDDGSSKFMDKAAGYDVRGGATSRTTRHWISRFLRSRRGSPRTVSKPAGSCHRTVPDATFFNAGTLHPA